MCCGHHLRVKGWEKIFQATGPEASGVDILISDKIEFRPKLIRRDKKGHYVLIKRKIHQEDITILNIHSPNTRAHKLVKGSLPWLKLPIDSHTLITETLIPHSHQ